MTTGGLFVVGIVGLALLVAGFVNGAFWIFRSMVAVYNAGVAAFCEAEPRSACPLTGYPRAMWERGWDYAWYKVRATLLARGDSDGLAKMPGGPPLGFVGKLVDGVDV